VKKFIISLATLSFRESGSVNATRQRDSRFVRDSPDGRAPAAQEDNLVIFQLHPDSLFACFVAAMKPARITEPVLHQSTAASTMRIITHPCMSSLNILYLF